MRKRTMRQSIGDGFNADEIDVAGILLELPSLILESESRRPFSFTWGLKRKRSAIDESPALPPIRPSSSPIPPSSSTVRQNQNHAVVGLTCSTEGPIKVKTDVHSPATPLSFSPSESEEKLNPSERKINLKRKTEDLLRTIQELTEHRSSLLGEIENVKRYYDDLKAYNSRLKAKEQQVIIGSLQRENPHMQNGWGLGHGSVNSPIFDNRGFYHHHQFPSSVNHTPLIFNQTSEQSQIIQTCPYPYSHLTTPIVTSSGLVNMNSNTAPLGVPDLNVCPDDSVTLDSSSQPLDVSIANMNRRSVMAAEARQKRIQICRGKHSVAPSKPRYYSNR
ncbi:Dihydroxy-acid dehydratase 1 [Quillaja saponaria]|uniref:Dihydroxy-acid dehydratase 1 n=1 Tax=Quillaja saponaria TaxID=32244 RepID=A0AAD7PT17_QUISA|nr:Dihydroxy-acid dehydratase 1 [Quillaja saponaria]